MKKCVLCNHNEAKKKNTHYLTDAIIRTCLNYEGGNKREKGFFFKISNGSPFVEFGFQRNTPTKIIEKELRRGSSDYENADAKKNPYAVNDVFCSDCENLFGKIEEPFVTNIHSQISKLELVQYPFIFNDSRFVRLFFILQFWRCHVCNTEIKLNQRVAEEFRGIIQNYDKIDIDVLKKYPMSVSFILSPKQKDHTRHFVGMASVRNPYVIFMNDYVIQLYDDMKNVNFYSLYGLNNKETFMDYINYNEDNFKIQIIQNNSWWQISYRFFQCEIIPLVVNEFINSYRDKVGRTPSIKEIKEIVRYYEDNRISLSFTKDTLQDIVNQYFKYNYGRCYE